MDANRSEEIRMKKSKITRGMLIYVYLLLGIVAIGLNWGVGPLDWTNIIVTGVMFLIVGMAFSYSYKKLGIVTKLRRS